MENARLPVVTDTYLHREERESAGSSNCCELRHRLSSVSSPASPPPPCCFYSPPVSEVLLVCCLWLRLPEGLAMGRPRPRELWVAPSIQVSCQMVSCTCRLKAGWARCWARIISTSKMMMLFMHNPVQTTDDCISLSTHCWSVYGGFSASDEDITAANQHSTPVWATGLTAEMTHISFSNISPSHTTVIEFNWPSESQFSPQVKLYCGEEGKK